MNYRHAFHAGNYGDVFKHVLLLRLLRAQQRKEKGSLYLDTHAGRGAYDLGLPPVPGRKDRPPEWPQGVGRLWAGTAITALAVSCEPGSTTSAARQVSAARLARRCSVSFSR